MACGGALGGIDEPLVVELDMLCCGRLVACFEDPVNTEAMVVRQFRSHLPGLGMTYRWLVAC